MSDFSTKYCVICEAMSNLDTIAKRIKWLMGKLTKEGRAEVQFPKYAKTSEGYLVASQADFAKMLHIDRSTLSNRLKSNTFYAEDIRIISSNYGIPASLLITGNLDEEIRDHKILGLRHNASKWLSQNRNTPMNELINILLGDEEITHLVIDSLYLYSLSPDISFSFEGEKTETNTELDGLLSSDSFLNALIFRNMSEAADKIRGLMQDKRKQDEYDKEKQVQLLIQKMLKARTSQADNMEETPQTKPIEEIKANRQ